ncbi:hypothetical protein [Acinetobacter dispersus]|uniref:hypothetical protein n=1 Tax=Acinetobacter dispersus TaxID=70348 RepID=UPI001F4A5341|nr:hypothetical protein [Acinetobacter dispersus]MCH7389275.1 hypothetical protein [Acinetobacter dispersus]
MSNKLLISTICSGALLLTACGGGGDNNQTSFDSKEKLDYKQLETTKVITESVFNLSNESDNLLIYITILTKGIYDRAKNSDLSCETGSVKINNDNTVTLNNCKNFWVPSEGKKLAGTVSGTILSSTSNTASSEKVELKLSNININLDSSDQSIFFNGPINYTFKAINNNLNNDLYETNQAAFKFIDKMDSKNYHQYALNNYQLISNYTKSTNSVENISKGQLNGEINGKVFSVNYSSNFKFATVNDLYNLKPNSANIEIIDLYNKQNTISIDRTTDGNALINTYAAGKLVQTFSQDWNEF